jgi:hypothetical protein
MNWLKVSSIMLAISLGCAGSLYAQDNASPSTRLTLQRDTVYEQYLQYQASPDKAITPAKVLRWVNSLMGHTSVGLPSNFEFQPIVRANENQKQVIAQFAYKF